MMGSGGSTDSGTGAHGAAATQALASLLEIISNPSAATATLKELTTKSAQIQNQLEQLEKHRLDLENAQKEITAKQQKALQIQNETDAKEANLASRELELSKRATAHVAREKFLLAAQQDLDKKKQEHSQREQALMKLEKDTSDRAAKTLADAERAAAEHRGNAESAWQNITAEATKISDEAAKKHETAAFILAEAEAKKQVYEKRLASLKQLALGD